MAPLFLLLLLQATPGPPADWSRVEMLVPETIIRIDLVSGGSAINGKVESAATDKIVLRVSGRPATIARVSIQRVSRQTKPGHRLRNAAIGMAVGLGAGLLIAAAADDGKGYFAEGSVAYTAPFSWLGAGVGALAPGGQTWEVLYDRPAGQLGPGVVEAARFRLCGRCALGALWRLRLLGVVEAARLGVVKAAHGRLGERKTPSAAAAVSVKLRTNADAYGHEDRDGCSRGFTFSRNAFSR